MKDPVLTVAIPFHRGQHYLREAIASVLAQDTPDWQLLVVDDAGPERGTRDIVEGFHDSRISYVRNEANLGMAGCWNRCLELARSPLVSLLHSDDRLRPDYVTIMVAEARDNPDAVLIHSAAAIIGSDGEAVFSFADWIKQFIRPRARRTQRARG